MIKFSVRDVNSKGLKIQRSVAKEAIGLCDEEIDLRSSISVDADIQRVDDQIIAHTKISADFGYICSRCLEEFHDMHQSNYVFNFQVTPELEYVDLGEEIRQELIMANPSRVLCREDCRGICPGCGVNLNNEKCKCKSS